MRASNLIVVVLLFAFSAAAQRIAILQPDASSSVHGLASEVRSLLARDYKVLDDQLADSAFRSVTVADPFNLSTSDARRIGTVIGATDYILLRSAVQRRASIGSEPYFEGYAIYYLVSSRTGALLDWHVESVRGTTEDDARRRLIASAPKIADHIADAIRMSRSTISRDPKFTEPPAEDKRLRTPVPYRRIRPEYTDLASNYGVRATIDIEVDVDSEGSIARTSIERWAGFGLEASVEKAVRSMNWRPAMRDGTPLPMRILLRYNFTKIEKDEAP